MTRAVVFVAFDGLSLLLFGGLVALAWSYRFRSAIHRRLMFMAMVALLPPAFGRLVAYLRRDHVDIIVLGLMIVTTLTFVAVDALKKPPYPAGVLGARPPDSARQRRHVFRSGLDLTGASSLPPHGRSRFAALVLIVLDWGGLATTGSLSR